ncbi:MAG: hypothetical protein ACRCZK_01965, partial [Oscillospiraceae bacterium]
KIGVIGVFLWMIFGLMILFYIYKNIHFQNFNTSLILFGICVIAAVIQTNPLLFSFSGMFMVLFLLLEIENLIIESQYLKY